MSTAARARRSPNSGWINPSRNDLIIEDARNGFNVDAICHKRLCDRKYVLVVLRRAYAFEFLSPEEAFALGVLAEGAAT